ncbi:ABC transporter substrate-binding protein [Streptacidiphilus fuscans]|uniref:Carbohydrate ABC transporter substrate-binding protein n=1 Tax=Streptacidiphilus fuscans TaxID=2789292 RepID=A0A931FCY7_9ACTN|nr:ABC transporter substrate-binding protein [Streptacidiphilus fuscans]MBF9068988.1 carbohydrate ABC transporter substrate-binding protein [Streptacidiphilus fuscans]MBF9073442.1 carbohydrate ABC transporter substrate-binding protein [Streptacidiphilus fuscans]
MGRAMYTARRAAWIAAASALVLGLSACGSGGGTSSGGVAKAGSSFTYWSMWRADEPQAQVLKAAIADFTASTGIKVNVDWIGRDIAKKIGPAIAGHQAPDLWDESNDVVYGSTASAGQALDLSPVLSQQVPGENVPVSSVIPAKYFAMLPKDPNGSNHYLIPYEVAVNGMFFNSADPAVKAAMPTAPTDWNGLLKACSALKAKGTSCIASEGEDPWTNELYFDYLLNGAGVDFNQLANDKSGAAWDNPAVLKAAEEVDQLVKGGDLIPGYDATKYPAQETNWASGKAAFYMDGDYVTSEVSKEVPATWQMSAMLPPTATTPDVGLFGFAIPRQAKNVSAAEQFIDFFMQKKEMSGIATTALNITPRTDIPAPADLADAQKLLSAPSVRLPFDGMAGDWSPKVLDENYLNLWHGQLTPQQFVAACKAAQVSYWQTQG